jgi:hypothetical protein
MKTIINICIYCKRIVRFIFGVLLAIALDIAVGMAITYSMVMIYDFPITNYLVYAFGITMALLPDVDTISVIDRNNIYIDHRKWPHHPSILLFFFVYPFLVFSSLYFLGYILWFYIILATLCILWHCFHDSWDTPDNEEGIQWGAPFISDDHYVIPVSIETLQNEKVPWVKRVKNKTIKRIKRKKETAEEWLQKHYLNNTIDNYFGIIFLALMIVVVCTC